MDQGTEQLPRKRGRPPKLNGAGEVKLKRPDPPRELNARQQEIWIEIVSTEPVEFFSSFATCELLKDFVCHRETIESLNRAIAKYDLDKFESDADLERYGRLLSIRQNETRHSSLVATRLRLTNQSRYTPRIAATTARNTAKARPWEDD